MKRLVKLFRKSQKTSLFVFSKKMWRSNLLENLFRYYCTMCCAPTWQHATSEIFTYFRNILYLFTRLLTTVNFVYVLLLSFGVFNSIHGKPSVFDELECFLWLMVYLLYFPIDVFLLDTEYLKNFDGLVDLTKKILNGENKVEKQASHKILKWKCWRFILFSA